MKSGAEVRATDEQVRIPNELPVLPLRDMVVFPAPREPLRQTNPLFASMESACSSILESSVSGSTVLHSDSSSSPEGKAGVSLSSPPIHSCTFPKRS